MKGLLEQHRRLHGKGALIKRNEGKEIVTRQRQLKAGGKKYKSLYEHQTVTGVLGDDLAALGAVLCPSFDSYLEGAEKTARYWLHREGFINSMDIEVDWRNHADLLAQEPHTHIGVALDVLKLCYLARGCIEQNNPDRAHTYAFDLGYKIAEEKTRRYLEPLAAQSRSRYKNSDDAVIVKKMRSLIANGASERGAAETVEAEHGVSYKTAIRRYQAANR